MIVDAGFSWRGFALYALMGTLLVPAQYAMVGHFGWAVPDFTLLLVIHAGLFRGAHEAGLIALVLGALGDSLSGGLFGLLMCRRVAILGAARVVAARIYSESAAFQATVVFFLAMLDQAIGWGLLAMFTDVPPGEGTWLARVPLRALIDAMAMVPLAWLLAFLYELPTFNLAKRALQG